MTTRKDIIRQASIFTMGGLVDPRVFPGYVENQTKKDASTSNVLNKVRRLVESLFKKIERQEASV